MRYRKSSPTGSQAAQPENLSPESQLSRATQLGLARQSRKESSSAEMREYLLKKGFEAEVAEQAVSNLSRQGFIDDSRYARIAVRHQTLRHKGATYIQAKLKQKGIRLGTDEIRELSAESSGKSELERAREIVSTRYPDAHENRAAAGRAFRALLSRGFSHDIARQAVLEHRDES